MGSSALTIEEMIRSQFIRVRNRGYARNFEFEDDCDVKGVLKDTEDCIVRVDARDGTHYHLTDTRILSVNMGEVSEVVQYDKIEKIYRKDKMSVAKKINYDTLFFDTFDGKEVEINNLGDSCQPVSKFLTWLQSENR